MNNDKAEEKAQEAVDELKKEFENICTELRGGKRSCRGDCSDMYASHLPNGDPISNEEMSAIASPVFRGIDTINDLPWSRFEEIRYIGENVFKVRLPRKKKWGIYPQKKINKRDFFFSVDPVKIDGRLYNYSFDEVYTYHNGVVKAVRGNEQFLISSKGYVIGSTNKLKFRWVEEKFGNTCPDFARVVPIGRSDTVSFIMM